MTRRVLVSTALGFLAALQSAAQSVTLELRNGDRISGTILSESASALVLSNAWARELTILNSEIASRLPVAAPAPALTNQPVVASSGAITNIPTNSVAMAKAVAATNMLFSSPWMKNWRGDLQAGVDLTFSERDRQVYNGRMKLTYAKNRFRNVLDYDVTYGRSQVEETVIVNTPAGPRAEKQEISRTDANRMSGSSKTDVDLTKKWYLYNLAGAGYDEVRKIDLRYEIGPGVGYRLIQSTNFFLNVEWGSNYQNEERVDSDDISTFFFRFAQNAAWKITPRLSWDEKIEYMPRVENFSEYRVRLETNLRYALLQNVYLNLTLLNLYDSFPASGVTRNDLQVRSSIGVKF